MRVLASVSLLFALGCDAPPVEPGSDVRQQTRASRIEGTVVVSGHARGNVLLFLYDVQTPPPPLGTGRPLSFSVVAADALFHSAPAYEEGPFTAPFSFSLVNSGRYVIAAMLDAQGDCVPWYRVTTEPNAFDLAATSVSAIDVGTAPVTQLTVSLSEATRVPVDRPVFSVSATTTLGSTPLPVELSAAPIDEGVIHQAAPVFLVQLVDANLDGLPDDANGDGLADIWPKIVVRKVAETDPRLDENDLDDDGHLDATGADYVHASAPADGVPDLVVLSAAFDVTAQLPQLLDTDGGVKTSPTPLTRLRLVVQPKAFDASDPLHPAALSKVPAGRYALTVIQSTGQTWRVPNELAPGVAETLGLPSIASQAFTIVAQ